MRVLLDSCVWAGAVGALVTDGHDVVWTGDLVEDPGDAAILALAYSEQRVLVTLDKDFGELAIVHRLPHSGIIRLVQVGARAQGPTCAKLLERFGVELMAGAIVTAEPGRVRIRPAD